MNEMKREQKLIFTVLIAVTVLSILLAAGFAALYLSGRDAVSVGAEVKDPAVTDKVPDDETNGTEPHDTKELADLRRENEFLEQQARELRDEIDALKHAAEEAETEYVPNPPTDLDSQFNPGDIVPADPESLSYTFDLNEQLAVIRALEEQMAHSPYIVDPDGKLMLLEDVKFEEDAEILYCAKAGTPLDEKGVAKDREIDYEAMGYKFPTIAISYRDMERGTAYSYNGDHVYFSASLIKAPYIYSLLHQIAQYNEIKKANPTNDPSVGKTLAQELWDKYDLERKITVTESMVEKGSGKIKDMDLTGGKEFTVLELIEYAIKVSDNTAFRILRNEYGYDYFWSVSRQLGVKSVFTSFNNLTADEACIYLAAIYDFAKDYPSEGGLLINLMKNANHQVLITRAVSNPYAVAHKYGWDADSYHDMALVYGDAPFAVCVMTNFDFSVNDDDLNEYIRSLVAEIEKLHNTFYRVTEEQKKHF